MKNMTNILSTFSEDFIKHALSEFHKPSSKSIPEDTITDTETYYKGIQELSKLHQIHQTHPRDVAISMMKERNVPKNVIKLVTQSHDNALVNNDNAFTFAWRLDQSVPNVQAVLLNVKHKTAGETKTMRMDLSTFHKLRFNVAFLLKEFDTLSKRVKKE